MMTVIIVGLSMGTTVMIAQAVGGSDRAQIRRAIGNTATLFFGVSIGLTALFVCFVDDVVAVMATPVEAAEETRAYLILSFLGIPFITAYNIVSSICRGLGDSRSPMYFIAVACVLNIVLDFLFIGAWGMGQLVQRLAR